MEFDQHENEIDENFYQNQYKESKLPRHPYQHLSNKVTKNASKIKVKSFQLFANGYHYFENAILFLQFIYVVPKLHPRGGGLSI